MVLGESGEAMMGSGMVRRLRYVGVFCISGDAEDIDIVVTLEGPLCEDVELLVVFGETFSKAVDCGLELRVSRVGLVLL